MKGKLSRGPWSTADRSVRLPGVLDVPYRQSVETSAAMAVARYQAAAADSAAWDRALRPKPCKPLLNRPLARVVADQLRLQWSLEQIAGWLKHTYPSNETFHVSHETMDDISGLCLRLGDN